MPRKVGMRQELPRWSSRAWRHQTDAFPPVSTHKPHGFGDVAVVAHHDSTVISIEPTVIQKMHREIDVRALLLLPHHFHRTLIAHRLSQRRPDPVPQEVPEVHLDLWPVVLERVQIHVLALRFRRIGVRSGYSRREVLDRQDAVVGLEQPADHRKQVEPFPLSPPERTVVEVEAIHLDECAH